MGYCHRPFKTRICFKSSSVVAVLRFGLALRQFASNKHIGKPCALLLCTNVRTSFTFPRSIADLFCIHRDEIKLFSNSNYLPSRVTSSRYLQSLTIRTSQFHLEVIFSMRYRNFFYKFYTEVSIKIIIPWKYFELRISSIS